MVVFRNFVIRKSLGMQHNTTPYLNDINMALLYVTETRSIFYCEFNKYVLSLLCVFNSIQSLLFHDCYDYPTSMVW